MTKNNSQKKKILSNNTGSSFVTVIVTITFLVLILLMAFTVSMANYQMKISDSASKANFYAVESMVDEIYTGIGQQSQQLMNQDYTKVLASQSSFNSKDDSQNGFLSLYLTDLEKLYSSDFSSEATVTSLLESYLTKEYQGVTEVMLERVEANSIDREFVFKGMSVAYTNEQGYLSKITTDLVLKVPEFPFFNKKSELGDFACIALGGIYIDNNVTLKGDVYGGKSSVSGENFPFTNRSSGYLTREVEQDGVYGGINVLNGELLYSGNYLVANGDINICNSQFTTSDLLDAGSNIWCQNIRTVKFQEQPATINLNGNVFVNDDLELDAVDSDVTIKGAYYGYNNSENSPEEASSSVIVNGKSSYLDLSGLNTLVIAGRAYIDFSSKDSTQNSAISYFTGESLALKSNQELYLVPPQYLSVASSGTTANPIAAMNPMPLSELGVYTMEIMIEDDFFGKKYLDTKTPYVVKEKNGYRYYYLNFTSTVENGVTYSALENSHRYFTEALKAYQNKVLDSLDSFSPDSITINNKGSIYTNGALLSVTKNSQAVYSISEIIGNYLDKTKILQYITNLNNRYDWLNQSLTKNEDTPISETVQSITSSFDSNQPLSAFVNLEKITKVYNSEKEDTKNSDYIKVIQNEDFILENDMPSKGVILVKGNVLIENTSFRGIIMATGKVYFSRQGTYEADESVLDEIVKDDASDSSLTDSQKLETYLYGYQAEGSTDVSGNAGNIDYTSYLSYDNWTKSQE